MKQPAYHDQVYQPEEDSILLLKAAKKDAKSSDRIIEIGTGSGFIASGLKDLSKFVIATDINPHACRSARSCDIEVVRTDLNSGIGDKFDLVLFNPPYLPTKENERLNDWLEYALDGGEDGRKTIEKFAERLGSMLSTRGRCLLLVSSLTGMDEVRKIFSERGYISFIVAEKKVEDETLFILRIIRDMCSIQ